MNGYMNELHKRVGKGWVLYLDDDNLLVDKFAISEFLATVQSRDALIAFRSHLGRVTPTDENFKKRVVIGDFDSSNFALHSRNIGHAKWSSPRCGDFRMGAHLSTKLPVQWVDRKFIQANPMRSARGGLGGRADMSKPSVTVVITSYEPVGCVRLGFARSSRSIPDQTCSTFYTRCSLFGIARKWTSPRRLPAMLIW